jgi:hypothetical protein
MAYNRAHNSHGHTPAAWTTVVVILIGLTVGAVAVVLANWPLFWIGGAGLVVVGGIVGKVMQMMGLGQVDMQANAPVRQPLGVRPDTGDSSG